MPFQGFPLLELRELKKKANPKPEGFSLQGELLRQEEKNGYPKGQRSNREQDQDVVAALLSPTALYETVQSTFRRRERTTAKQAKYFSVKLPSESPTR